MQLSCCEKNLGIDLDQNFCDTRTPEDIGTILILGLLRGGFQGEGVP